MGLIRVALVDDHEIVRIGLRNLISRHRDLTVACECATGAEAIQAVPHRTDVVVLDVRLPDRSGLEVCRQILAADTGVRVSLLTSFGSPTLGDEARAAGAAGCLLKESGGQAVIDGIRVVAQGGTVFSSALSSVGPGPLNSSPGTPDPMARLGLQERKVLALIAEGKTNREIARQLFLRETTVKHYVTHVLRKLGYTRRSQAAAYYARYHAGGHAG
jgi:DNA-binding NarL/FixJ family response regulator